MTLVVSLLVISISMSVARYRPKHPVEKHWAFERLVWRNSAVCNNCFSRLKDVVNVAVDEYPQTAISDEMHYWTGETEVGYDAEDAPETAMNPSPRYFSRATCGQCGSVGGRAEPDPLSRRAALFRCDALARRLEEEGYEVDEKMLRSTVRKGKEAERLQGFDREIFAIATRTAIERPENGPRVD